MIEWLIDRLARRFGLDMGSNNMVCTVTARIPEAFGLMEETPFAD